VKLRQKKPTSTPMTSRYALHSCKGGQGVGCAASSWSQTGQEHGAGYSKIRPTVARGYIASAGHSFLAALTLHPAQQVYHFQSFSSPFTFFFALH
jgi:hypothetical protein